MIDPSVEMYFDMIDIGFDEETDLMFVLREDGQHAEWFWDREFQYAYEWLFFGFYPPTE